MSLDISISRDGHTVAEMNWLRNPFGLAGWVRDNTGLDLRFVNEHTYDRSDQVDRAQFLERAREVHKAVAAIYPDGIFRVAVDWSILSPMGGTTPETMIAAGLVPLRYETEPRPSGAGDRTYAVIWMRDYLQHLSARERDLFRRSGLDHYKAWAGELVEFAEQLQDPDVEFYCSD